MRRALAAIACIGVTVICAACGSTEAHIGSAPTSDSLVGGKFAGYLWDGNVTTVHGQWQVPAIAGRSRDGHASTWIGAEAPGNKNAPFIQIGTTEDKPLASEPDSGVVRYTAFWSDQPHGFHPVELFLVSPGDKITTTMTLKHDHWTLSIRDATNGKSKTFTTAQEGSYGFNLAEWLQEDVTNARTGGAFPYPDMDATHFSGISVNSQTPHNSDVQSQWISTSGRYYGTSPVVNGNFTVSAVTRSSVAGRYLAIAAPEDTIALRLYQDMSPRTGSPEGQVAADAQALARAMKQTASQLGTEQWPSDVQTQIKTLIKESLYISRQLDALKHPTRKSLTPVLSGPTPYGNEHITAPTIHQILGIPFPPEN
jgi:Peptidase A4 family